MSILVLGSINMDLVVQSPRLPKPGETITGHRFFTASGGKGANQAVAAARLGADVRMIGRVGGDRFGSELLQRLAEANVQTDDIFIDDNISSGVALIAIDDAAQNNIIIVSGANGRVDKEDLTRLERHLAEVDLLLLQLEIPLEMTIAAAQMAQKQGVRVILDPAPAQDLPPELFEFVNIVTPNEVEAEQLVHSPVTTPQEAGQAAKALLERGVSTAIVKLGAQGVVFASKDGDEPEHVPAYSVTAIDSVAAGDTFNGGLATSLVEGHSLPQAIRWGAAAGALSTTKAGAQPSMPTRPELESFLKRHAERPA